MAKKNYYTRWKSLEEDRGSLGEHSELIEKIMHQLGVNKFIFAGHGTMGDAYFIPSNKVLKITTDRTEAVESMKIKGKKLQHIANIYEVYSLKGKYDGIYVIISEQLDNDPNLIRTTNLLDKYLDTMHFVDLGWLFRDYKAGEVSKKRMEDIKAGIERFYENAPQDGIDAEWLFDSKMGIVDDMRANNINTKDFNHLPNQGLKKNGVLAIFDLGFGDHEMPQDVENIHLAEELTEEDAIHFLSREEEPDFLDGQENPLMNVRPYPPTMNMNSQPLGEEEISQDEIDIRDLPLKHSNMFDDFVTEKTESEIREIAPLIDLGMNPHALVLHLEKNSPDLYDSFAQWLHDLGKR
jgi:hypothetical protein